MEDAAQDLRDVHEREAAIREILDVIAASPSDYQPVFEVILDRAARLCDAPLCAVLMVAGDALEMVAWRGMRPEFVELLRSTPIPLHADATKIARSVVEGRTNQVADLRQTSGYEAGSMHRRASVDSEGMRTQLAVPLMGAGGPLGGIVLYRREVREFSERQIELVEDFARQAVVAIENVRRFRALDEALERERATAEVLRVIAASPTDYEPVFEAILDSALRLCDAPTGLLLILEGEGFRVVTVRGARPEVAALWREHLVPLDPELSLGARSVLERRPVEVLDISQDSGYAKNQQHRVSAVDLEGMRTLLAVPLLRGDEPVGAILVYRREVRGFDTGHVALLSTFADQAVIALDNVRQFQAVEARTEELGEALERQTATSDILRVINRSPDDYQPVFEAILASATRLCDASHGILLLREEAGFRIVCDHGARAETSAAWRGKLVSGDPAQSITARAAAERRTIEVPDVSASDSHGAASRLRRLGAEVEGIRTQLTVPMLRGDEAVGVILVYRREVRSFEPAHVALVSTFAEQAAIAVDNVRRFRALGEALERQTATSEVLRAISRSPTDYQPVLESMLENATRICDAPLGILYLRRGDRLECVAMLGGTPEFMEFQRANPLSVDPELSVTARAIAEGTVQHYADISEERHYRDGQPNRVMAVETEGIRALLVVPLLKDSVGVGAFVVYRREVRAFADEHVALLSTFADQAVIAIENVRLFQALQTRTDELAGALQHQTATSEVLRVISRSSSDYRPVFEAILDHATRLCEAPLGFLLLLRDGCLHLAAERGARPESVRYVIDNPLELDPEVHLSARAVLERRTINVADRRAYLADGASRNLAAETEAIGSQVTVPMIRGEESIGVIVVYRREVRPFDDSHVDLLTTFAEQAVIAIDNVRQFEAVEERTRELTESLERQTAMSEILRVISRSPTDYQPVFEAILENASRLCGSPTGILFLRDGEVYRVAASSGVGEGFLRDLEKHPHSLDPAQSMTARAAVEGVVVRSDDIGEDILYRDGQPHRVAAVDQEDIRSVVSVPLRKEGEPVGTLCMFRREVRPFEDEHVELLSTFADQAVIAIENVRLFQALEARTGDLTEALERQTATSDILRTISRSPTDFDPVFDAILESATRLCEAPLGFLLMRQGDEFHFAAHRGSRPEFVDFLEANPVPLDSPVALVARSAREGLPQQLEDIANTDGYRGGNPHRVASFEIEGIRTGLFVPMMRGDTCIGVISIYRREARAFDDSHVALVSTFADQAVIAIDNVRLFQELEARTHELGRSVGELRALGDVGQAVSSTLELETVLTTIIKHAVALSDAAGGAIAEHDEATGELPIRAAPGFEALVSGEEPARVGEGAIGQAVARREPVQIPDVDAPGAYTGRLRHLLPRVGFRALLAVPLLREDRVLGALLVGRSTPGEFPAEVVELLRTFAAQSALAIHNARLFRELEEQGRELEAANRHKSEFLANMSHELRTPLNAVIGFSEVLAEEMFGELNEKQAEYVGDIHVSGRHLLSLINDILDLSKVEAGRMELDLSRFAIGPALDNALTLVAERASRRGVGLERDIDDALGEMTGDERKLKQILLNLLSNAIKFTPAGGQVTLLARCVDGTLEVTVRDTGVGISAEDQAVMFEAFRQVGTDYARKVEGTGLGLTLTRRFVELHGGTIVVDSEPGQGSEFRITLPVEPPPAVVATT